MTRRLIVIIVWPLLLVVAFFLWASHGHPFFVISAVVLVLVLVVSAAQRRYEDRSLLGRAPDIGIAGLQYRTSEGSIEFRWTWSRTPRAIRVLRSATRWPQTPEAASSGNDAVAVYEDDEPAFSDADVEPLGDYRYAFFTWGPDGWSEPVLAWVTAADSGDAVEAMDGLELDPSYERAAAPVGLYLDDQTWNPERPGWHDYDPGWLGAPAGAIGAIFANLFVLPFKVLAELIVSVVALVVPGAVRRSRMARSSRDEDGDRCAPDRRVVWPRAGTRPLPTPVRHAQTTQSAPRPVRPTDVATPDGDEATPELGEWHDA